MGVFSLVSLCIINAIILLWQRMTTTLKSPTRWKLQKRDKAFKRRYQAASPEEQEKMGYDVPHHADMEDIIITEMANEWLRDGKPVD